MDNEFLNINALDAQSMPFSLEAEQSILGAVLIDPGSLVLIADKVSDRHFHVPQHRAIYSVFLGMLGKGKKIDPITVLEQLKEDGVYDDAGGKSYLLQLAKDTPTSSNIESYAEIVLEKYTIRSLIIAAKTILNDAIEEPSAQILLQKAEQLIYKIREGRDIEGLVPIKEIITGETMLRLDRMNNEETKGEYIGIPYGFDLLDKKTTGMYKGDLIIIGARPGMGKTSLALEITKNVALHSRKTVCFFTLEMTREQIVGRLLSNVASINGDKIRTGMLENEDWGKLAEAGDLLSKTDIYVDQSSDITVNIMKAKLMRKQNIDLVIVDYLGLMYEPGEQNRVMEIQKITGGLKKMAKELEVPVIVCSQLSRGTDQRGKSHKPQLSDLRDSGAIEQDADCVMFIYREEYYKSEAREPEEIDPNAAEIIIAKNRHGETGKVNMRWYPQFSRFVMGDNTYD